MGKSWGNNQWMGRIGARWTEGWSEDDGRSPGLLRSSKPIVKGRREEVFRHVFVNFPVAPAWPFVEVNP
jgi:hypothetical protein